MFIPDNIDDCLSSPCLNGASCVDDIARYDCICQAGYTSTNCEGNMIFKNKNRLNQGTNCLVSILLNRPFQLVAFT